MNQRNIKRIDIKWNMYILGAAQDTGSQVI